MLVTKILLYFTVFAVFGVNSEILCRLGRTIRSFSHFQYGGRMDMMWWIGFLGALALGCLVIYTYFEKRNGGARLRTHPRRLCKSDRRQHPWKFSTPMLLPPMEQFTTNMACPDLSNDIFVHEVLSYFDVEVLIPTLARVSRNWRRAACDAVQRTVGFKFDLHPDWFRHLPNLAMIEFLSIWPPTKLQLIPLRQRRIRIYTIHWHRRFRVLRNLTSLTTSPSAANLFFLTALTALEDLHLTLHDMTVGNSMSCLSGLTKLRRLCLDGAKMDTLHREICHVEQLPYLSRLELHSVGLLPYGPSIMSIDGALTGLTRLESLAMSSGWSVLSDPTWFFKGTGWTLTQLKSLEIITPFYEPEGMKKILAATPVLTHLTLTPPRNSPPISFCMHRMTALKHLDVQIPEWICDETLRVIGGNLKHLSIPRKFQATAFPVTERGLHYLTSLVSLDIRDNDQLSTFPDHFSSHLRRLKYSACAEPAARDIEALCMCRFGST